MKYTLTTLQTLGKEPYTAPELCIYETPAEQGFQLTEIYPDIDAPGTGDYGDNEMGEI